MKKPLRVGLVVVGNATASPVLRLSCLADELGPIKSSGLQVARRISNILRAGYGVGEYQALETAQLILLKLPDSAVRRIVEEIAATELPFGEISFVLCESWLATDILAPLKGAGAQIASLVSLGTSSQGSFVVEGDASAVRRVKRLLERGKAKAIEIANGAKALYFAANLLCTAIPVPALQLAQYALRQSGVGGNDLALVMKEWSEVLEKGLRKGGRTAWGGPLAACPPAAAAEHFRRLARQDPVFAAALDDWLALAQSQMSKRAKGQTA